MRWTSVERMALADEVERVVREGLDVDLHVLALDIVGLFERVAMPEQDTAPLLQSHTAAAAEVLRSALQPNPLPPRIEVRMWRQDSSDSRAGLVEYRPQDGVWDEATEHMQNKNWTIYHIDTQELL